MNQNEDHASHSQGGDVCFRHLNSRKWLKKPSLPFEPFSTRALRGGSAPSPPYPLVPRGNPQRLRIRGPTLSPPSPIPALRDPFCTSPRTSESPYATCENMGAVPAPVWALTRFARAGWLTQLLTRPTCPTRRSFSPPSRSAPVSILAHHTSHLHPWRLEGPGSGIGMQKIRAKETCTPSEFCTALKVSVQGSARVWCCGRRWAAKVQGGLRAGNLRGE